MTTSAAQGRLPLPVLLAIAPALFASNMVAARWAHDASLPPVFLAFGRWLLALVLLLPWVARPLWRCRRALRAGLPTLLPLAVLGMGVAVAPQYIGAQHTQATNVALIFTCSPLLVVLIEALVWRAPLPPARAGGLLLALAGVLIVLTRGHPHALLVLSFGVGDLWVLLAATGWACYTVLLKRLPQPELPGLVRLAALMAGGALALAPFALVESLSGQAPPWHDEQLYATLGFLALAPSLGAYFAYARLVDRAGPAIAGFSLFLIPLYAAALSWPLLGETPRLYHAFGMVFILAGVVVAGIRKPAANPAPLGPNPKRRLAA